VPPPDEGDRAAELLERLLVDGEFRALFRRDPAAACQEFDLPGIARELAAGGKSLHTLEIRESRSSLAGALMAAASEGASGVASLRQLHEQHALPAHAHRVVGQALTSSKLQAVGHPLDQAGAGGGALHDHLAGAGHGAAAGAVDEAASARAGELLANPNLTLSPDAHAVLLAGGADHRLVSVLTELTKTHKLQVGSLQLAPGGRGDSFDIFAVDGHRVAASNVPALDLVDELSSLGPGLRPEHIVSPWPLAGEGFSTDPGHDDRIHVVFGEPMAGGQPPAGVASVTAPPPDTSTPGPAPAAAPATDPPPAAAPAPPAAGAPPAEPVATAAPPAELATPSRPPPAAPAAPPAEPTPTPAPAPAPAATVPPEPTTPPPAGFSPPDVPQPALDAAGRDSLVLGSVPAGSGSRSTLQFDLPGHHAEGSASGGGAGAAESLQSAYDPASAGGLPDPSDPYPGDNASEAQIAAWMGRQAHKAGLPAELPVMAGLVESGLKNVNYGDRDSLGFFQMRTSVWNQGEYAGFANHPELQLKWFLNEAIGVRRERIAEGDASYGNDPNTWGEWVADVERPATEYRGRYQLRLDDAESLLKQGGANAPPGGGGAAQAVAGTFEPGAAGAAAAGSPEGAAALAVAEKYIGTPYQWGGDTPQTGFDCSGLAEYAYGQVGIHLPRVAADQFNVGIPVTKDQLKPGDLVFFQDSTGYIHHVGIYVGNDMFLQAPHTGDVVKISSLDEPYYAQQFAGGRDVSGLATGAAPPVEPATPAAPPADPGTPPGPAESGESGLFAALGDPPPSAHSGSTVQILPAVTDPADTSGG
jgi:cell wall-associated NlpC family hydrolase